MFGKWNACTYAMPVSVGVSFFKLPHEFGYPLGITRIKNDTCKHSVFCPMGSYCL